MKNILPSLVLFGASMVIAAPYALAQSVATDTKKSAKPAAKKTAPKGKAAETKEAHGTSEDDKEPDIAGSVSIDYQCELGNNLTIFENTADDQHVALRWNKRLVRLKRVDTTTGANRFENQRHGLVWIGIPAKGILLDSKKGQQLANNCKNAEQMERKEAPSDGPGILGAPTAPIAPEAPATVDRPPATKKPRS